MSDIIVSRSTLEAEYGKIWDTDQLRKDFEVTGFLAPIVAVVRKRDNQKGTLQFIHMPRFYFDFKEDDK